MRYGLSPAGGASCCPSLLHSTDGGGTPTTWADSDTAAPSAAVRADSRSTKCGAVWTWRAERNIHQAQSDYKHVLANILRSLFVARTPSEEASSPGRRSNVENAPRRRSVTGEPATPTSHIRRAILRTPPVTRQSAASSTCRPRPAGRSHYVVISRDRCKFVTTVCVMLPLQRNPCPDCKSAQQYTTRGQSLPCPQVTSGSVQ